MFGYAVLAGAFPSIFICALADQREPLNTPILTAILMDVLFAATLTGVWGLVRLLR